MLAIFCLLYLEEVCVSIGILESIVYVTGKTLPVGDVFRITLFHGRPLYGVKSPVTSVLWGKKDIHIITKCITQGLYVYLYIFTLIRFDFNQ